MPSRKENDRSSSDRVRNSLSSENTPLPSSLNDNDPISQDDIDRLLQSSSAEDEAVPALDSVEDTDEPDLISQEDIDRLLDLSASSDAPAVPDRAETDEEDVSTFISQDDIDRLLQSSSVEDEAVPALDSVEDTDEPDLISQEDIDRLLDLSASSDAPAVPDRAETDEEDVSTLISQDDIDRLLQSSSVEDEAVPVLDSVEDTDEPDLISQEDIDRLLDLSASSDAPAVPDRAETDEEDVSTFISQDDIDRLIESPEGRISETAAETKPADEEKTPAEGQAQTTRNEAENESDAEPEILSRDQERVILAEDDADTGEAALIEDRDTSDTGRRTWYASMRLYVLGTLLLVCSGVGFFLYLYLGSDRNPALTPTDQPLVLTFPVGQSHGNNPAETLPGEPFVSAVMEGFFVPTPVSIGETAYLEASLSIELNSVISADEIKKYNPFFRSIVFEILENALTSKPANEIKTTDLEESIRDALNRALPESAVEKVVFTHFSMI